MNKFSLPFILAVFATLLLTACSDENVDKQASSKTEKITFSAKVTGEVTEELVGKPWLFCTKSSIGPTRENRFELSLLTKKRQQFELNFPQALGVGTHPVYGANTLEGLKAGAARVYYSTSLNGKTYSGEGTTGELTLTAVPKNIGDSLTGTLKLTAMAKDYSGTKIQIEAEFDVIAGNQSMDECK